MLSYEHIHDLHRASSGSESQLYALIDHAGLPGLVKRLKTMNPHWVSLFEGSRDEGAIEVAPILFPIPSDARKHAWREFIKWIGEQGLYTSSILFLASPLPMRDLAARLAVRIDATLPENVDIVLRYFDTRTFESMIGVISLEQREAFLGVAHCWWFVDRAGELQEVQAAYRQTDDCSLIPLEFTDEQQSRLLDESEPDHVAGLLRTCVPFEYEALAPYDRYDFIIRNIEKARSYGIVATHESSLFCALALLHGESFALRDGWSEILKDVQLKKIGFTDAVEKHDE